MTRHRTSRPLVLTAFGSLAVGVACGVVLLANRSTTRVRHTPGTEAWPQHGVVALVAVVLLVLVIGRRRASGRHGEPLLLAPVSVRAAGRLAATMRVPGPRALATAVLLAVLGYCGVRAGMQVTGGLDPNFTANAWGGPGYLGAMACHYVDAVLIAAATAGMLDRLLGDGPLPVPGRGQAAVRPGTPETEASGVKTE